MKKTEAALAESLEIPAIRELVLKRMFYIWAFLGGMIVTIVVADDVTAGRYGAALFYLCAYGFVVISLMPRLLPYLWRCTLPLGMLYVVGSHEIYNHGLNSAGTLFYFGLVVLTCILVGARTAIAVMCLSLVSLCGVSYVHARNHPGLVEFDSAWAYYHVHCLPDVVSLALLSTLAITLLSVLLQSLERSIKRSHAYLEEIARERNQLVRLIEARDQAEQQLRQAQKLEAVGQLAGGVAHDFNNLLQVVSAHTDILLSQCDANSEHHAPLEAVRKASERAAALTRQLLAYSRQQVMAPEYLDLNQLIEELIKMVRRVIPEHIEIRFRPAEGLGTVHADPGQIEQVLMNLCLNARDAMPGGGTLTIRTGNVVITEDDRQRLPGMEPRNYVLMQVEDTGVGIAEADLEHIFDPFYTTKSLGEGTGLGLPMAYGIVKQHSGSIQASSTAEGAQFSVYLPQVDHPARVLEKAVPRPASGGSETVLVAEDDEAVRTLIIAVLRGAGFTVLPATNGEEAVLLFEEHEDAIDLLLFDVVMPRMGGREACEAIRSIRPDIRVLFMSGYAPEGLNGRLTLGSGTGFLQKPYRTQQLLEKIREILDS